MIANMAASANPAVVDQTPTTTASGRGSIPFDPSKPPVIEGFSPLRVVKDETFKEKFLRKTKDNPFVPIGELHKPCHLRSSFYLYIFLNPTQHQAKLRVGPRFLGEVDEGYH